MRDVAAGAGRIGARDRRTTLLGVTLASFLMLLLAAEPAFAAPGNDNFATVRDSTGTTWDLTEAMTEYGTSYGKAVQATNSGATRESNEPAFGYYANSASPSPYKTVWYRWTAPADGRMSLYDLGDGCDQYLNASVGVYTGDVLASLTPVNRATEYCSSGVRSDAKKGTTYYIQVGSPFSFEYRTFKLGWSLDRFDNDEDGVLDADDDCPFEAATTTSGCPEADLKLGAITMEPDPATVGEVLTLEAYPENFGPNTATNVVLYISFPKGTAVPVPEEGCDSGTDYTGNNTYVECQMPDMTSDWMGTWTIDLIPTKAGEFTLPYAEILSSTVRDPDQSNNIRNDVGTVTVNPDTTPPAAPTGVTLAPASDTGASSTDGVTNKATPTITGKAEASSTVKLYDGVTNLGKATANSTGVWSFTPATALTDGAHSVTATATDGSGNVSAASAAKKITVDTKRPSVTKTVPLCTSALPLCAAPAANAEAYFSEAIDRATVNAATFTLVKKGTTSKLPAAVVYDAASRRAILNPSTNLAAGASYTATVTSGAKDVAGNALDQAPATVGYQPKSWTFGVKK